MTKRSSSTKRRAKPRARKRAGRLSRFLRAFTTSAIVAFSITSCALNPQLRDHLPSLTGQEDIAVPAAPTGAQLQTRFSDCPQFFPGGQAPIVPAGPALHELCFSSFAILHSGQTKTPVFVAQRLNRKMLNQAQGIKRTDRFYSEARLPTAQRAQLDDYRGSGYSRGHMAPAGDMHTLEAMAQSFSLANMVPQDQRHNAGAWSKVESDTRKYVMRAQGDVYVLTGPVYDRRPQTIGPGKVAVPGGMFKLVYDVTTGRSWVHWQANSPDAKVGPPISYAEFVRRTGLQLSLSAAGAP
ncbi:DNA/RNA non-specific endonuclease [Pollutimonas thiosulfatoxidans]|uniref:Endonuclease n=1 Tax=Pollutimonas thiosulfatoxidans TaxID=2028345 RepID=A0A410G9A6_9BURK|nr:DNA/RNA non-specific endonuclease [Pollutimonas thiosulfatoxidans]QAA92880.1 endonuclease [Pollutimonas thiosulfatoxidans]